MQNSKIRWLFLFLLLGMGMSFFLGSRVWGYIPGDDLTCAQLGYDCGTYPPTCGDKFCGTWLPCYGTSKCRETCGGGYCVSPDPTYNCANHDLCGGTVDDLADCTEPNCSACVTGECSVPSCDGGIESCIVEPECEDGWKQCVTDNAREYCVGGFIVFENCADGCAGGICLDPVECESGETKCENDVYSECVETVWEWRQDCGFGCDENGLVCNQDAYCEDYQCELCNYSDPPEGVDPNTYWVRCWTDSTRDVIQGDHCVQGTSCEAGVCHPIVSTCGGTLTEENCEVWYPGMGYVSHIDNCGGQDCGPPCGGPGCIAEYPMKPTLLSPTNGGVTGTSATLSWERNGWGVGCPQDNSQELYLEAGDSSPDVSMGSLGASVGSYDASNLETGTLYYWKVRLRNGSLSMDSDIFSFSVNGLIEGYLFDSGGMSVCPADLSDPAYDSRKIGGGLLDITSGGDSYFDISTIADGSYSQAVTVPGSYVLGNFRLGAGFVTTPDLVCDGTSVEFVLGGDGTAVRSFGFLRDYDGWWQGTGGDVYGGLGIKSVIPGTCTVGEGCQPYLIKADGNGESGLARYLSGSIDFGNNESASVGPDGWVANSGYAGQNTNYAYYTAKMALLEKTSWAGSGKPVFNPEIGSDYEIYVYIGTATIDFDVAADEKMIFMVGGDVDVSSDVNVAEGGHLAVIALGKITFASGVAQAEGWWVGDSLNIESTGDTGTEVVFRGEGSFVGWNGVSLNRDRGGSNATEPAEEFVFRPDLMINAPIALKFSRYVWQEKAP